MKHVTLLISGLLLLIPSLSACTKRPATTSGGGIIPGAAMSPSPTAPTGAGHSTTQRAPAPGTGGPSGQSGSAMSSRGANAERPSERGAFGRIPPSEFSAKPDLLDVHFAFDRADITAEAARILDANAVWLRAHTRDLLLIEGHTDERGTSAYNLALGDRRAAAAKNYLVAQGVQAARITTISYGKERPACRQSNEACWAKNRRAHFPVRAK